MAITTNGQLLGLTGKVGPVVTYQWRGKWITRSFAAKPKNPQTEKQQKHRMLFKQEVQLAGRMNWVLRETMDAIAAEHGMTACNYFIKRNKAAFSAEGDKLVVDWSALVLSEGPVAPVAFGTPEIVGGTTLSIAFEGNPQHLPTTTTACRCSPTALISRWLSSPYPSTAARDACRWRCPSCSAATRCSCGAWCRTPPAAGRRQSTSAAAQ